MHHAIHHSIRRLIHHSSVNGACIDVLCSSLVKPPVLCVLVCGAAKPELSYEAGEQRQSGPGTGRQCRILLVKAANQKLRWLITL